MQLARLVVATALGIGFAACHHDPPPDPAKAEAVGAHIPASPALTGGDNKPVALADVTSAHAQTVVVFYRGYF